MAFEVSTFTNTGMELLAAASATKTLVLDHVYCFDNFLPEEELITVEAADLADYQYHDQIGDNILITKISSVGIDPNSDNLSRAVVDLSLHPFVEDNVTVNAVVVTAHWVEAGQSSAEMTFYCISDHNGIVVPYNAKISITQQIVFSFVFNRISSITVADSVSNYLLADETKRFLTTHSVESTMVGDDQEIYGNKTFHDYVAFDTRITPEQELSGGIIMKRQGDPMVTLDATTTGLKIESNNNPSPSDLLLSVGTIYNPRPMTLRASMDDRTSIELSVDGIICRQLNPGMITDLRPIEDDSFSVGFEDARWFEGYINNVYAVNMTASDNISCPGTSILNKISANDVNVSGDIVCAGDINSSIYTRNYMWRGVDGNNYRGMLNIDPLQENVVYPGDVVEIEIGQTFWNEFQPTGGDIPYNKRIFMEDNNTYKLGYWKNYGEKPTHTAADWRFESSNVNLPGGMYAVKTAVKALEGQDERRYSDIVIKLMKL